MTDTFKVIENTTEEMRFSASSKKPCILTIRDGSGVHVGIDMLVPKLSPRSYKFSADNTQGKEHVLTDTYRFKPGKYFASASRHGFFARFREQGSQHHNSARRQGGWIFEGRPR